MENRRRPKESDFRESIALCPNCSALFKTNMYVQYRNMQGAEIIGMPELTGLFYCPNCDYPIETTKNSMYDFVEETFQYLRSLGKPEMFFLNDAFITYNNSLKEQKDKDELKYKVNKVAPKLFTFSSFIPANSAEWAGWFSLIATILFGIIASIQSKDTNNTTIELNNIGNTTIIQPKVVPDTSRGIVGRNDQCPCGSGKKFKKCHGIFK